MYFFYKRPTLPVKSHSYLKKGKIMQIHWLLTIFTSLFWYPSFPQAEIFIPPSEKSCFIPPQTKK